MFSEKNAYWIVAKMYIMYGTFPKWTALTPQALAADIVIYADLLDLLYGGLDSSPGILMRSPPGCASERGARRSALMGAVGKDLFMGT